MSSHWSISEVGEEHFDRWDEIVRGSPTGSIYQTPTYLDALCTAAGGTFRIVWVLKGEAIKGGLALYERTHVGTRFVSPRLLLYYNGPVLVESGSRRGGRRDAEGVRVLSHLAQWLESAGYGRVSLKPTSHLVDVRAFLARGWSVRPTYSYVVPTDDPERMWGRLDHDIKRLVKRAEEAGMVMSEDDDFGSFYQLHRETMTLKGHATYLPSDGFRVFVERLTATGLGAVFHARTPDGRAVATSLLLLGPHPVAHTVCAAGWSAPHDLGANSFLRWKVLEALRVRGFEGNDLTDASLNSVTRFKRRLGGHLNLSLEVDAPRGLRYRIGEALQAFPRRARSTAGRAVRSLLPGRAG